MNTSRRSILALCAAALASPTFAAGDFPNRPVKIVVPFAAGSSVDISARRVGDAMGRTLGKPVVIENITGAGGLIGIQRFLKAPADGYTLFTGSISSHGITPVLTKNLPYDPVNDFVPISKISSFSNVLVVHPSLGVKTLPELVSLLKKQQAGGPTLSFASGGKGTTAHLGGELLKQAAAAEILHVPYGSVAIATPDLLAGRVSMMFGNVLVVQPFIEKGQLVPIANTGSGRSPLLPDVPTVREQGYGALELMAWAGLFAPAGTPPEIVRQLHAALRAATAQPEVREHFRNLGGVAESDGSPEEFGRFVDQELRKWAGVTRAAGLKPE